MTAGGNPDLLSENGMAADIGWITYGRFEEWTAFLESTAFFQGVRNQIVWVDLGSFWSPINVGRVRSLGAEVSARLVKKSGLLDGVNVFFTYTNAVDRSNPSSASYNKQLRYTPEWQLKSNFNFSRGRFQSSINLLFVGQRFVTSDESQSLDPYLLLGGRFGVWQNIGKIEAQLDLALENMLDTDYQIISSYGMPPRVFRIELVLKNKTKDD